MEYRLSQVEKSDRKLLGLAAVFNQETRIGGTREVILPGAFTRSLSENPDILALADHDQTKVLGRTKSGSLRLQEGKDGLRFELDLPDTQTAKDLLALATRGDLGGCSIGFIVPKGGSRWEGDLRVLSEVQLAEISIVSSFAAYRGTSVEARAQGSRMAYYQNYLRTCI
jgi:uncharacterized protein